MSKTSVITVKQAPSLRNPEMTSGIRDKAEAASWASKRGYVTVYFLASRQRVYAERMAQVVEQAAQIEQASAELLKVAEAA